MSNFWIEIASNGMPVSVQKCEFEPSILSPGVRSRWVNFGKLYQLSELGAELAATVRLYAEKVDEVFRLRQENQCFRALAERGAELDRTLVGELIDQYSGDCRKALEERQCSESSSL